MIVNGKSCLGPLGITTPVGLSVTTSLHYYQDALVVTMSNHRCLQINQD